MRYNHFDMLPERAFLKVGGRITLEGGGGGGGQTQQTSTAYQTNIPAYLEDPAKRMVSRGETLSEQGYQPYTGERVAGFSPMQQAAFQELGGMATPEQFAGAGSAITGAQQFGTAGALGAMGYQPGTFGTAQAQQYMSPYQQAVTDIAKREAVTDAQRLNTELGAKAAKAGAFGGSRFGIEQALLGSKLATNLSDIQTKGLQDAYLNAQQQYERDRAAGLAGSKFNLEGAQFGADVGLKSASQLQNLGTAEQDADLKRISAQQAAGAQQQALEQQKLDAAYQQYQEQRDWEKNQLGFLSGLIRGTPFSTSQLQSTSAPGATTASQIASLGLGAYGLSSLLGKKDGGAIKGYANGGSVEGYAYGGDIKGLSDQQLQEAAMGKSDIISPEDAKQELSRRANLRTAVQGVRAEEELASGVAALPADNMEFAADGGIMGYAEGGSIPRYNGNKEYGSVVYGGIEYPIDPTTGKVFYKGAWTSPSLLSGSAASPWNTVGVKPEKTVQQKADAIAANEQMIADVQAGKGVMKNGAYYPIITEGKNAGKVDYKGIPTMLDKRMFDSTPPERLVKPSADNTLQAEHAAAAIPPTAPAAPAAPAAAPAASASRPGVIPGSPAAGKLAQKLATQEEDPYTRMLAGAKRVREEMAAGETDPFKDLRASMAEQKAAYADMHNEGRGLAALQAAAAIAQGGPGGTIAQIGRGMGALGEAGFKLQNQLQAARQADMSSRVMMAQAEEARNRGLRGEAIQLATGAEQAGLQAAKLKQDYQLGMAQINATRANAGRNTQLELIQALQKNPDLLKTYQGMHAAQEKPLSDADILKSWDPLKYPGMTYAQYYASMKNAGSMAPTSSLSASDQALVNKYAK
jgi:hypothetical protein